MAEALRTVFYDRHVAAGAKIVEFGGWDMPLQDEGILQEHLATRKGAGLFDVSHMGRFFIRGEQALPFLQHVLTNNAASLDVGLGQYTMIPSETGGAIDDAYLYRFVDDEYLLVVNAANRAKDWNHLERVRKDFPQTTMVDRTFEIAMLSLQGPGAREVMEAVTDSQLPDPMRNELGAIDIGGADVLVARTGYTGEPICFELFVDRDAVLDMWEAVIAQGAHPIGLGARAVSYTHLTLPTMLAQCRSRWSGGG